MDRERWARMQALFEAACDLESTERRDFLEAACGSDSGMKQAVESLILHEQDAGDTLHEIVSEAVAADPAGPGTVGPYRIVQRIGEGGMGEVYEAEQERPVRRRVALKLIKAGMDTRQVVARFESERQALALMNHSNIAQVFDAGATDQGRPYFAMELVRGVSIVEYCDTQRVPTRERIRLFMQVCDGVQHAHQKGIIHRDLKPSNVIVTIQGDRPLPKIIDFGVAKAVDRRLTERTLHTELGMLIGTPEYMSPEQAEMTGLDIDTRTDVYALGVLLYELLVGARPFETRTSPSSLDDIRRRIREEEPSRPSTWVTGQRESAAQVARNRRTEPGALQRELRGDLDWIVLKALEKDRTRRYGSPAELAADLRRHLDDEPVLAGPPAATYRMGKFVRRHRAGVAVAAAFILLLAGFGATMAWQAARLARQRDAIQLERATADQVSDFMVDLFRTSNPSRSLGHTITAREVLDKGADRVRTELAGQPVLQARLMLQMGDVYGDLGLFDKARELLEQAVDLTRRAYGDDSVELATALHRLGMLENTASDFDRAERVLGEALTLARRHPIDGDGDPLLGFVTQALGDTKLGETDVEGAEFFYRQALEIFAAADGSAEWIATAQASLGVVLHTKGDFDGAEAMLREALERHRRSLDPDHPLITDATTDLAAVLHDKRDYDGAERLYRQALASGERVLGHEHPDLADTLVSLGRLLRTRKDFGGAEEILRRTLAIDRGAHGEQHENVAYDLKELGGLLREQGKLDEAERVYSRSVAMYRRVGDPGNPHLAVALRGLAGVLRLDERYAEARPLLQEAADILTAALPEEHWLIALTRSDLGECLVELGQHARAEELLLASHTRIQEKFGDEDPNTIRVVQRLIRLNTLQDRPAQADAWRTRLPAAMGSSPGEGH